MLTFYYSKQKKRTEYYENGNKKISYTWKRKREKDDFPHGRYVFDYTITKRTFDESGVLLEVQDYEYWRLRETPPRLEFSKSDWINKWVKIVEGKEITIATDVDTETYLKTSLKDSSQQKCLVKCLQTEELSNSAFF